MATLTVKYSMAEQASRLDPNGMPARIVEQLNVSTGGIVADAPAYPSNDTWGNKTARRVSLPTGQRRKLNAGVTPSVSRVENIWDNVEMIADYAEYDKDYIDSFPNPASQRMIEAMAFVEGIGQTIGSDVFYGNANTDPDQMHGLAPRMATLDSKYIIGGGGTGSDVSSIYGVTWGPDTAHLIYPKNMQNTVGVKHSNLGEVTLDELTAAGLTTGRKYQGYRDYFEAKIGLVIRNPKAVIRYANIETAGSSNIFDEDFLIKAMVRWKKNAGSRLYVNQTIAAQMWIAVKDKTNVNLVISNAWGEPILTFNGIPFREVDDQILLITESAIA